MDADENPENQANEQGVHRLLAVVARRAPQALATMVEATTLVRFIAVRSAPLQGGKRAFRCPLQTESCAAR